MAQLLTTDEIREYISDYPEANLLLDKEEFSDTFIELSISLAIDIYNTMPPVSLVNITNFPSKAILLYGTCWQMFSGRAALMARNELNYSDGGLNISVEEKYQLYANMAGNFRAMFMEAARALKTFINLESGWGRVYSDEFLWPMY